MTLPTQFVSPKYDQAFLNVHAAAFSEILRKPAAEPKRWEELMQTLNKHALLTVMMPRTMMLPPISIKMGNGECRTVEYKKPIDCGFDRSELRFERELIANPAYLAECSAILAYMWARKILPSKQDSTNFVLLRMNAVTLSACLRKLHRGQSDAETVAHFILASTIDQLVEGLIPDLKVHIK